MTFSDIQSSVSDAWEALWPPVAGISLMILIVGFVCPASKIWLSRKLEKLAAAKPRTLAVKDALETLGISKVIPIAVLIAIVFVLYAFNMTILLWVDAVPPSFSFEPAFVVLRAKDEQSRLAILRSAPNADSLSEAFYRLSERLPEQARSLSRSEPYLRMHRFIKLAFVASLVGIALALIQRRSRFEALAKASAVVLGCVAAWLLVALPLIYNAQQDFFDQGFRAEAIIRPDWGNLTRDAPTSHEKDLIGVRLNNRWWHVHFFDPYYFKWFKFTFLDPWEN
jgi:hypothetical protein